MSTEQTLVVTYPDTPALTASAQAALASIESMVIDSHPMLEIASDEVRAIVTRKKSLDEQRTKLVKPLNDTVKNINDMFRQPLAFLDQAEKLIKGKIGTYQAEQERLRLEEQRRRDEEARQERERIAKEAAEREVAARAESERLEREAREQAAAGNAAAAEALKQQAAQTQESVAAEVQALSIAAAVTVAPTVMSAAKVAGISSSTTWKARVTDKAALVAHIAANPSLLNLLDVNESALNQMAKALKENLSIPGAEAYPDTRIAARKAA